jgi:hypothetical protein
MPERDDVAETAGSDLPQRDHGLNPTRFAPFTAMESFAATTFDGMMKNLALAFEVDGMAPWRRAAMQVAARSSKPGNDPG